MKKTAVLVLAIFLTAGFLLGKSADVKFKKGDIMNSIHWLHHSSFRIESSGKIIYFDPFQIKQDKPADYIFITHNHPDHMSIDDIKKIANENTLIICPKECEKQLKDFTLKVVVPGEKFELGNISVEAVPAYNNTKLFHPKKDLKVGYIIELEKQRIYHAGDTDFIPEMRKMKNIHIAMVPIGGFYTMEAKEAAEAINAIKPDIAVPMHYGYRIGKKEDANVFKSFVDKSIKVEVMNQEE